MLLMLAVLATSVAAQQMHDHPAPEKLGDVSFPISCKPATQPEFNRGVALLHSFAYTPAEEAFRHLAEQDPDCAMAHWGIAMTYFHELWEPPLPAATLELGLSEIQRAKRGSEASKREREWIHALGLVYENFATVPYATRTSNYERAMSTLAEENRNDVEAQIFYALALLNNASPFDSTHSRQKRAAALLEPLFAAYPEHPGIPHYLIHAYDNAELAPRGLTAARSYAKIAPSAPHALHMPSHIFTRLGLWQDSIASNIAAREAARRQHDAGEELHAMDYLVYAYLQSGLDADAARVIEELRSMPQAKKDDFKIGYASTAMPVRYAVERRQWAEAANISSPPAIALPQVIAIAVWARGIGLSRSGRATAAHEPVEHLQQIEAQLRAAGNEYWADQAKIMTREVMAWTAQASHKPEEAVTLMRAAAAEEDALEKLPVTPGPVVPAREQLGDLLLEQDQPDLAFKEFQTALISAPGRRGALGGAAEAARRSNR
ncbi:MAG: hypothetical protein M3O31_13460 [Acidobacteriota bacterium]|nr:hypothetical protein [Acidobacteriota bacterium]